MTREEFVNSRDVSRETLVHLDQYVALTEKWTRKINLVSKNTVSELWSRHILDSAQLYDLVAPKGHWVDLGSGGGFPGLVVAILGRDSGALKVTLIESDQRKCAFLRTVSRELSLNATVICDRIESAPAQSADILSARALSALPNLLGFAERHLKPEGIALFPKGATHAQEVRQALETWQFDVQTSASITDPDAVILQVKDIHRG